MTGERAQLRIDEVESPHLHDHLAQVSYVAMGASNFVRADVVLDGRPVLGSPFRVTVHPARRAPSDRSSTRHGWRAGARECVARGGPAQGCSRQRAASMRRARELRDARLPGGDETEGRVQARAMEALRFDGRARGGRYELLFWLDEGPALPRGPWRPPRRGCSNRVSRPADGVQPGGRGGGERAECDGHSRRIARDGSAAARVVEPAAPLHPGCGGQPSRAARDEEARGGHADRGVAGTARVPPAAPSTSASGRRSPPRASTRLAVRCAVPGVDRAHRDAQRRARAALALAARDRRRGRRRRPLSRLWPGARLVEAAAPTTFTVVACDATGAPRRRAATCCASPSRRSCTPTISMSPRSSKTCWTARTP